MNTKQISNEVTQFYFHENFLSQMEDIDECPKNCRVYNKDASEFDYLTLPIFIGIK